MPWAQAITVYPSSRHNTYTVHSTVKYSTVQYTMPQYKKNVKIPQKENKSNFYFPL